MSYTDQLIEWRADASQSGLSQIPATTDSFSASTQLLGGPSVALWNVYGGAAITKGSSTAGPDGTGSNADSVNYSGAAQAIAYAFGASLVEGNAYTFSVYLKVASGTFRLKITRGNGVDWTGTTSTAELTVTTDWQRFTLTFTAGASDTIYIGYEAATPYNLPDTPGTVLVFGAMLNTGSSADTYSAIPPALDLVRTNFTWSDDDWSFDGTGDYGSIAYKYGDLHAFTLLVTLKPSNTCSPISWGDGPDSGAPGVLCNGTQTGWYIQGAYRADVPTGFVTSASFYSLALSFGGANVWESYKDGSSLGSGTYAMATLLNPVYLFIGAGYNQALQGLVRTVMFWPRQLTDAELLAAHEDVFGGGAPFGHINNPVWVG